MIYDFGKPRGNDRGNTREFYRLKFRAPKQKRNNNREEGRAGGGGGGGGHQSWDTIVFSSSSFLPPINNSPSLYDYDIILQK